MTNTNLFNSEAIGIQNELQRHGAELEQMCKKGYTLITIEQIYLIQGEVLRFRELEPNYKEETVTVILRTIAAAISTWYEPQNRWYFYGYMDQLHPLLSKF